MKKSIKAVKAHPMYIEVEISCYNRRLGIGWDDYTIDEERVQAVADDAYERWVHVDENPEVESYCCEEYILHRLDDALGMEYDYCNSART